MIQANKTIRAAPFYQLYIIADDKNEFALLAQTPQVFVKNIFRLFKRVFEEKYP